MSDTIYVGVDGSVVAYDKRNGQELWRTHLRGSSFVAIHVEGDVVIAHTGGHLYGVDATSGRELWTNGMKGLGYGLASIAGPNAQFTSTIAHLQATKEAQRRKSNT